jgi:hypothetical protein
MLTLFLFICALPVLVVLFLIGLRILLEALPVVLGVGVAVAILAAVLWSGHRPFDDWLPADVTQVVVNGRTESEYRDGKQNGPGTVTRPNGTTIVGTFLDGKISGQGTITWPGGDKLVAEFHDAKLEGPGTLTWANGDRYAGEFRNGKRTGRGTYTRHDGLSYDGEFVDGRFEGQGALTLPNGDKFVGEFRNGKQTKNGTFTRRAPALCQAAKVCEAFAKVRVKNAPLPATTTSV